MGCKLCHIMKEIGNELRFSCVKWEYWQLESEQVKLKTKINNNTELALGTMLRSDMCISISINRYQ